MQKKIINLFTLMIITIVMVSSCASSFELAQKALQKGDYKTAVAKAADAVVEEPSNIEAQQVLETAWTQANQEWTDQINSLKNKNGLSAIDMDIPDWVKSNLPETKVAIEDLQEIISIYSDLIYIHEKVENAKQYDLNPDSLSLKKSQTEVKQQLSDIYFTLGEDKLNEDTRESAQEALYYFKKVENLVNTYPNIQSKLDEATEKATVKVVILQNYNDNINGDYESQINDYFRQYDLIEVVAHTKKPDYSLDKAIGFVNRQYDDADLLIYLDGEAVADAKPAYHHERLNSNIARSEDLWIGSARFVVSGSITVDYTIYDLKNNEVINTDTIGISDSTDYGFEYKTLVGGEENCRDNIVNADGSTTNLSFPCLDIKNENIFEFTDSLLKYHNIDIVNMAPILTSSENPNSAFDDITSIQELAENKRFNGKLIPTFAAIKFITIDETTYYFIYRGDNAKEKVDLFNKDLSAYKKLESKLSSDKNFSENSKDKFIADLNSTIYSKLKTQIAPFIK
jgi:hypothetical protein